MVKYFYDRLTVHRDRFLVKKKQQMHRIPVLLVLLLYMFRAASLTIIRSS